jgi:hypothetical protein
MSSNGSAPPKPANPPSPTSNTPATLTEICILGNLAKRMDARLDWDGPDMKVTNLPGANKFVHVEYRPGWSL